MPKKSTDQYELSDDDYDNSMLIIMKDDGERLYLHGFEDDLTALDFLETMVASFRIDMMERIMRRSMN
jgi:hypothetical protein